MRIASWCLALPREYAGRTVALDVTAPDGSITAGEGIIADDGRVVVAVGINEGGPHTVIAAMVGPDDIPLDLGDLKIVEVLFDPETDDCTQEIAAAPTTTT